MIFRKWDIKTAVGVVACMGAVAFATLLVAATAVMFTGCTKGGSQTIDYEGLYASQKSMGSEELLEAGDKVFSSQPDSAFFYYSVITARYTPKLPAKEQYNYAKACVQIGKIYFYSWSNYQQALTYFLKALDELDACRGCDPAPLLADIYFNMGAVYTAIDDLDWAGDYYKKAFHIAVEHRLWALAQFSLANMGSDALQQNKLPVIESELEAYLSFEVPESVPKKNYFFNFFKALNAVRNGNYPRAYAYFDSMERMVVPDRLGFDRNIGFILLNKQEIYALEKRYDSAIAVCLRAEKYLNDGEGVDDMKSENYKALSRYYKIIGNRSASLDYIAKALDIQEHQLNTRKLSQIHHLKAANEIDRMTSRIQEEERKSRTRGVILVVILTALAVSIALLLKVLAQKRDLEQKNRRIYLKTQQELEQPPVTAPKYACNNLDEERKQELLERILEIMNRGNQDGEIYSDDFSVGRLSALTGSNEKYISQVINEMCGKNFSDLLNEYRIKEACRRIRDTEHYGHLTIEGIANGLGFKSRGNFYAVFKKVVGLTPAQYRRIGDEIQAENQVFFPVFRK